jgi:hypothetical protein|tara:strand:- start:1152 stop:1439 length:288 start_codon:yes stop_codon:yes gene_type:complete
MAKVDRIEKIVVEENSDNDPMDIELLQEFKEALLGVCRVDKKTIPVYSYIRLVELAVEDGIDEETAVEWVDSTYLSKEMEEFFNGAYIIVDDTGV